MLYIKTKRYIMIKNQVSPMISLIHYQYLYPIVKKFDWTQIFFSFEVTVEVTAVDRTCQIKSSKKWAMKNTQGCKIK